VTGAWSELLWLASPDYVLLRYRLTNKLKNYSVSSTVSGHAVAHWLRHCTINRKVAGSIPNMSMAFFIDIILLVSLWPWSQHSLQQKWVPEIFPWGKSGRCVGLTTLPPSLSSNLGASNSCNPQGLSRPVMGLLYLCLLLWGVLLQCMLSWRSDKFIFVYYYFKL
jgi:hypothetical protein